MQGDIRQRHCFLYIKMYILFQVMNKVIIIIGVLILLVGAGVTAYFINQNSLPPSTSPTPTMVLEKPTPTIQPKAETKIYQNESGFKFNYPTDLTVTAGKVDSKTYANVEFTSPTYEGKIVVKVADTTLKTIDAWLKQNKISSGSAELTTTKLADVPASQVEKDGELWMVAIDQGVLYTISAEYEESKSYWMNAFNTIVDSFEFELLETTTAPAKSSGSTGSDDIILEEETIE